MPTCRQCIRRCVALVSAFAAVADGQSWSQLRGSKEQHETVHVAVEAAHRRFLQGPAADAEIDPTYDVVTPSPYESPPPPLPPMPMQKASHFALIHDTPDEDDPSKILLLNEPDWGAGNQIVLNCSGGVQAVTINAIENYVSLSAPLAQSLPVGTPVTSGAGFATNLTMASIPGDNHLYVGANSGFLQEGMVVNVGGQQYESEHTRTKVIVSPPVHIVCQKNEPGLVLYMLTTTTTTTLLPVLELAVAPCPSSSGSGVPNSSSLSSSSSDCSASESSGSSGFEVWQWLILGVAALLCCLLLAAAALMKPKKQKSARDPKTGGKKTGSAKKSPSKASSDAASGHAGTTEASSSAAQEGDPFLGDSSHHPDGAHLHDPHGDADAASDDGASESGDDVAKPHDHDAGDGSGDIHKKAASSGAPAGAMASKYDPTEFAYLNAHGRAEHPPPGSKPADHTPQSAAAQTAHAKSVANYNPGEFANLGVPAGPPPQASHHPKSSAAQQAHAKSVANYNPGEFADMGLQAGPPPHAKHTGASSKPANPAQPVHVAAAAPVQVAESPADLSKSSKHAAPPAAAAPSPAPAPAHTSNYNPNEFSGMVPMAAAAPAPSVFASKPVNSGYSAPAGIPVLAPVVPPPGEPRGPGFLGKNWAQTYRGNDPLAPGVVPTGLPPTTAYAPTIPQRALAGPSYLTAAPSIPMPVPQPLTFVETNAPAYETEYETVNVPAIIEYEVVTPVALPPPGGII